MWGDVTCGDITWALAVVSNCKDFGFKTLVASEGYWGREVRLSA